MERNLLHCTLLWNVYGRRTNGRCAKTYYVFLYWFGNKVTRVQASTYSIPCSWLWCIKCYNLCCITEMRLQYLNKKYQFQVERNSTKLYRKQDLNVLYQVCVFRANQKNKMAALATDWLIHFRLLLLNGWTEFNETWQEARSQRPLPSLCFSGRSKKQDGRPAVWLVETFSTSSLKPLNGLQRNLIRSKISTSTNFFFRPMSK